MSKSTAATRILAEELFRYREARDEAIDKGDSTMAHAFQNDIYEIEDALYKLGWYDEQKHLNDMYYSDILKKKKEEEDNE